MNASSPTLHDRRRHSKGRRGCQNVRALAARVLSRVLGDGRSLAGALPEALNGTLERDRALLQEICYGVLRWHPQLRFLLDRLLAKPLPSGQQEVEALLLSGLYQLLHLRIPDYAVVSEAVAAARNLNKGWAGGLINGVLRGFLRRRDALLAEVRQDAAARTAHPAWLLRQLEADWPQDWQAIVAADNTRPPYHLRVNLARLRRDDYLARLAAAGIEAFASPVVESAVTLAAAIDVERLPGFAEGLVSVQDMATQLAAQLMDLQPGQRVLDACAAPGGKTCHMLEREPRLAHLLALDNDAERLIRVRENLDRLGFQARIEAGDGLHPHTWWDGVCYDRILLDAPCSGTGVIRRHPDIKVLRTSTDIEAFADRQRALLDSLWPLLAPGGMLVYATCSVLKRENEAVVAGFLATHPDAREWTIAAPWGREGLHGRRIPSGEMGMDGFFYVRLLRTDRP